MNSIDLVRDDGMQGRTKAEPAGDLVVRPFQLFALRQASGGLVLLCCAILALAWANSPCADSYARMPGTPQGLSLGE